METMRIKVTKMGCNGCVKSVTKALSDLDGVTVVDVKVGEATIQRDKSKIEDGDIMAALEAAGYPASLDTAGGQGALRPNE